MCLSCLGPPGRAAAEWWAEQQSKQDTTEEEDDAKAASLKRVDEDDQMKLTHEQTIVINILSVCRHFLVSENIQQQYQVLAIIEKVKDMMGSTCHLM